MSHLLPTENVTVNRHEDLRQLRGGIEALHNLIYLASHQAEDAQSVRTYMAIAEKITIGMLTKVAGHTEATC